MPTSPIPRAEPPGALRRQLSVIGVAVLLAVHSQFYRSSVGVIAPDLMDELTLAPQDLGKTVCPSAAGSC